MKGESGDDIEMVGRNRKQSDRVAVHVVADQIRLSASAS
jgi:hypothetical protein